MDMRLNNKVPEPLLPYRNRVDVSGNKHMIDRMLDSITSVDSPLDFEKLVPQPKRLEFDECLLQPYLGFIAKVILGACFSNDQYGEGVPIDAICGAEGKYLETHPEIPASKWLDSKEEFICRYRNISKGGFKIFFTRTKPFSEWAAIYMLEWLFDHYQGDLDSLMGRMEDEETDYFKSGRRGVSAIEWVESKRLFWQFIDVSSPAFAARRQEIWGASKNPEDVVMDRLADGSLHMTFTTLGGTAAPIFEKQLSRRYPELTFVHSWANARDSKDKGCALYSGS